MEFSWASVLILKDKFFLHFHILRLMPLIWKSRLTERIYDVTYRTTFWLCLCMHFPKKKENWTNYRFFFFKKTFLLLFSVRSHPRFCSLFYLLYFLLLIASWILLSFFLRYKEKQRVKINVRNFSEMPAAKSWMFNVLSQ